MKGFWKNLPKPFFALAPLADVTDPAFRRIIAKYSAHGTAGGGPHVFWTEFVSADGLFRGGYDVLVKDLAYTPEERPIVAQFFSAKPELMEQAAALGRELGFDGIDINMGCPDRGVEKQGTGAAMIKNPPLAKELIRAAMRGAGDLPVSVKTRIGYNKIEIETWLPALLEESPAAVTLHGRTRKELSLVPAHWDVLARAVEIRNEMKSDTLIIGNGDVADLADARIKAAESGVDGIMFGRAIFGNPWLFNETHPRETVPLGEQLRVLVEHTRLFEELLGGLKSFAVMKKHYKAYVTGFEGAKELRMELMEASNATGVARIVESFRVANKL
jgi:nifR3 family TIM-barrel protein